jgi:hypothetical protein
LYTVKTTIMVLSQNPNSSRMDIAVVTPRQHLRNTTTAPDPTRLLPRIEQESRRHVLLAEKTMADFYPLK